jgi:hypothetical protein
MTVSFIKKHYPRYLLIFLAERQASRMEEKKVRTAALIRHRMSKAHSAEPVRRLAT